MVERQESGEDGIKMGKGLIAYGKKKFRNQYVYLGIQSSNDNENYWSQDRKFLYGISENVSKRKCKEYAEGMEEFLSSGYFNKLALYVLNVSSRQ
jgi:hypothetical protein